MSRTGNTFQPDENWGDVEPGALSHLLRAQRPAVYFAAKIGDSIMTLPTIRALAEMFEAPLTLICPDFAFNLCFREVSPHFVDITGVELAGPAAPRVAPLDCDSLAAQIGSVDVLINAVNTHLPMTNFRELQQRVSPTTSVGIKNNYERYEVTVPKQAWHACDVLFKLARLFDASARIETYSQPVPVPAAIQDAARSMRAAVPDGQQVVVVHADTDWQDKRWSITRFIDLLDQFLARHPEFVAWVVGMGDEELNVGRERDRVVPHLGLPLDLSISMLAHADLFVGVDSCMLHAADLARVPGVGLFGPTRSVTWGFRFGPHRHVDQRRMTDITAEEVLDAMEDLVQERLQG